METKNTNTPVSDPSPVAPSPRKRFPTLGDMFAMLGIALGAQIVGGLLMLIAGLIGGVDFNQVEPRMLGRAMCITYFVSMSMGLLGILYYRRRRGGSPKGLGRFSVHTLNPVLLLWAFALMLAAGVVFEPVLSLLPQPSSEGMGRGIWTLLMLAVLAPVFEEVMCRGVVLESLRAKYGVMTAWLGSSAFFAVLHMDPVLTLNAFALGLILGYIYIATNSLWAVMILHGLNNAVAYVLLAMGHEDAMLIDLVSSRTLYVLIYIGALALAAVSGYMVWRNISRLHAGEKNSAGV